MWQHLIAQPSWASAAPSDASISTPEPVKRLMNHAASPGAPPVSKVLLKMQGQIRVGSWLPFQAIQLITQDAYVWVARAGWRWMPITGFDRYNDQEGEMRWLFANRVPVMRAGGPDIARSAAGRLAIDATVFLPSIVPKLNWKTGTAHNVAVASWSIAGEELPVAMAIDAKGSLRQATMERWARPSGKPWGYNPFGGSLDDDRNFGSFTIPTKMRVGYWFGTDRWPEGEFLRAQITDAAYL
jgi:hypothetical protein